MGTLECRQCQLPSENPPIQSKKFKSMQDIETKFKQYAQDNMLGLYDIRCQKNIQKLYILGQSHVCDLILKLSCQKQVQKLNGLLDELENIQLQELDHLSLILQEKPYAVRSYAVSRFVYDELDLHSTHSNLMSTSNRAVEFHKLQTQKKMDLMKNVELEQIGRNIIQNKQILIVAAVQCFNGIGVLKPLNLPTNKTPLRIFLQKIQTLNSQYLTNIKVLFILNPNFQTSFNKQITTYHQCNQQLWQQDTIDSSMQYTHEKVLYVYVYNMCRNLAILIFGDGVKFNYGDGDLVGFMAKNGRVQEELGKYKYVQMVNISNVLERIADSFVLGYMGRNTERQIVAMGLADTKPINKNLTNLKIKGQFLQTVQISPTSVSPKIYHKLTDSYYFKSSLLTHEGVKFQKIISNRIRGEKMQDGSYQFVRHFQNVLYANITLLLLVQNYREFSLLSEAERDYSNFGKMVSRINDSSEDEIVQICPQMLFGDRTKLKEILIQLSRLPSIGFPLVINMQKVEIIKESQE